MELYESTRAFESCNIVVNKQYIDSFSGPKANVPASQPASQPARDTSSRLGFLFLGCHSPDPTFASVDPSLTHDLSGDVYIYLPLPLDDQPYECGIASGRNKSLLEERLETVIVF